MTENQPDSSDLFDIRENCDYQTVAARYPHVAKALAVFWGQPEFDAAMDKFLHDTRDGTRKGFPVHIAQALLRLSLLHHEMYPPKQTSIWDHAYTPR